MAADNRQATHLWEMDRDVDIDGVFVDSYGSWKCFINSDGIENYYEEGTPALLWWQWQTTPALPIAGVASHENCAARSSPVCSSCGENHSKNLDECDCNPCVCNGAAPSEWLSLYFPVDGEVAAVSVGVTAADEPHVRDWIRQYQNRQSI